MRNKFGVIGNPIAHSLSPLMHNAAFRDYKLDYEYERILISSEEELALFFKDAAKTYIGLNVTLPYKSSVIKHLDDITPDAQISSSVNVISIDNEGLLHGYSTDGYGLETALRINFASEPTKEKYLFLGCGGAANSCIVHLLSKGAEEIIIANRTLSKAENLIVNLRKYYHNSKLSVISQKGIASINLENYLVVQSTSLGLKDTDELPIDEGLLNPCIRLFDMIYKETRLQRLAREHGCKCFGGLDMLLYQGARAFEIWTGLDAPVEIMRKALIEGSNR